jgi:hypothetical protein
MAMNVHGTPVRDMDRFIMECACLFHGRQSGGHLSLLFCILFFKRCAGIALQHALDSAIDRKVVLVGDVYSKPPITIRLHKLHASDVGRAMGEIASYHKKD